MIDKVSFVGGQKYRIRAVEARVDAIGANATPLVEVMFDVVAGALEGRRIKWRGFLSPAAKDRTLAELALTGWKGRALGDWSGLGSVELEGVCAIDEVDDSGTIKRYPRIAFLNALPTLARRGPPKVDVEALNRAMGLGTGRPAASSTGGPPPGRFDDDAADDVDVTEEAIPF